MALSRYLDLFIQLNDCERLRSSLVVRIILLHFLNGITEYGFVVRSELYPGVSTTAKR